MANTAKIKETRSKISITLPLNDNGCYVKLGTSFSKESFEVNFKMEKKEQKLIFELFCAFMKKNPKQINGEKFKFIEQKYNELGFGKCLTEMQKVVKS